MTYAALIAALIIRPHKASFVFVFFASMYEFTCGDLDGHLYFPLAALCDFTVTGLLFNLRIDRKVYEMMLMSVISIILNLCGWLLWYTYQPPDTYVTLFGIFYIVTIMLMLRKDSANDGTGGVGLHIDYAIHHPDVNASGRMA